MEYEPEAFPGLVYRMDDPKVVLLLFGSGKMVCVGAREVNNIKDAVRNIKGRVINSRFNEDISP